MICDVTKSLLFLIEKVAFFNKQQQGFIVYLSQLSDSVQEEFDKLLSGVSDKK